VTELLLISDVPRLRKVFKRMSDERDVHLRVAISLEKGGEEIAADKPAMVFVQTHLSGLSAEILLMHLKKQLGRRRTRFVLLSQPEQVSPQALKQYHGHIDTALDDNSLFDAIREMVATLSTKSRKNGEISAPPAAVSEPPLRPAAESDAVSSQPGGDPRQSLDVPAAPRDTSLEDQGIIYAPRPQLSVYSEFTSSFDNAVDSLPPSETSASSSMTAGQVWSGEHQEVMDAGLKSNHSKPKTFLFWLVPVLIVAVVVTILQQSKSGPKPIDVSPSLRNLSAAKKQPVSVETAGIRQESPSAAAPAVPVTVKVPAAENARQSSEQALESAIAEKKESPQQVATAASAKRPATLPDFIPRYGFDKSYGAANPGWERYKGAVTEFKIYREGASIKAIQVIDRGGRGVPESFMKGALRQLAKAPSYAAKSSERKDGYEIQRGQVTENLQAVYYRDVKGGRLRAFVVTWK